VIRTKPLPVKVGRGEATESGADNHEVVDFVGVSGGPRFISGLPGDLVCVGIGAGMATAQPCLTGGVVLRVLRCGVKVVGRSGSAQGDGGAINKISSRNISHR